MPPRADTATPELVRDDLLAHTMAEPPPASASPVRTLPAPTALPLAPILGASAIAHVLLAIGLGGLGPVPVLALSPDAFVEIELSAPRAVAPLAPEPPPAAEPSVAAAPARPRPVQRAEPTPEPTPPEPAAAPPSLDDVFGAEPAPAAEVMAAQGGTGGPAMDLGAAAGIPGGRAGGTGEGVGRTDAGGREVAAGPTEADRRRARRAYVRSLEGMLGGRARYPRALERAGVGGRVELCIRVGEDGRILGRRVCASAGHAQLDDAALAAAHGLDRVPAPPPLAAWSASDEIHAGIVFAVR